MTAFNFSSQLVGLSDFGTDLGGFFSNLLVGLFPGLLLIGILSGILGVMTAIVFLIINVVRKK